MRRSIAALAATVCLLACHGCARMPAGFGGGTRLVVTIRLAGPVNDNYQYFVLMRNGNDQSGQNGPVPVLEPPYNNGFATGRNTATAAFTDFVEYSRAQRNATASGYGVYHLPGGILGDPNRNVFVARGEPDATVAPGGGTVLQFQITVDRLAPDIAAGETDPNNGQAPRYLQVNVVATTTTPIDPVNQDPAKYVDAFGDRTQLGSGFITIDLAQIGRTYISTTTPGDPYYEPDGDTYPGSKDPAVDMTGWSIQVTQR